MLETAPSGAPEKLVYSSMRPIIASSTVFRAWSWSVSSAPVSWEMPSSLNWFRPLWSWWVPSTSRLAPLSRACAPATSWVLPSLAADGAHAGHKELDLRQIVFQGADIGNVLALGGLEHQLVVDDLPGVRVGGFLEHGHEHGGAVALHQPERGFQITVRFGGGEVEGQVQLAGLELWGLLPDGAHHLFAAGLQRFIVQGQNFINDSGVIVPGEGRVDEAALHQGLAGGIQNPVGHLLGTGGQGRVVGSQGIQALGQLVQTTVQLAGTIQ